MTTLLDRALDVTTLKQALAEVLAREGPGKGPRSLRALADGQPESLVQLAAQVRSDDWRPRPLHTVRIPKKRGGERELALSHPPERVLERAILTVLEPHVDPHLSSCAYAYRGGVAVGDAVRRVVELREAGWRWVVRADFDDCFASIDASRCLRQLALVLAHDPVVGVVQRLLRRPRRVGTRLLYATGLAQGSSLSPLLCNLYLEPFDRRILRSGLPLVRYADDFLIAAHDQEEARRAMTMAEDAASSLGLAIDAEKSQLMDFARGFAFLGEDFNDRYPPADLDERIDRRARRVLYVGVQGAFVSVSAGRVRVTRRKAELLSVPQQHVERVVGFGSVTVSPGLRSWAVANDVEVVFCSRGGGRVARLASADQGSVARRRQQFERTSDPGFCVDIARSMIRGKLHNQRVMLERLVRPERAPLLAGAAEEIQSCIALLADASSLAELLGIEGLAARRYFEALAAAVPSELAFRSRTSRPPTDVVNAALSYGYAILVGEAASGLAAAGLDPAVGVLHQDRIGRPSLALDLIEELRSYVVDAAVLRSVATRSLTKQHGREGPEGRGVWLTEEGRRRVVGAIERRLLTLVHHPQEDHRVSLRRAIHLQARHLAA